MRYRLLASYQGAPYEAGVGPGESGVVLFAACPPPEDLHFEPATGHWRKTVRRGEVQSLYESRPIGLFRGERCVILDDLTDRLHIAYLGHDALKAEELGYWEVDRGVFELIAPRQEVTEVVEQRLPIAEPSMLNGHRPGPPPGAQAPGPGRGSHVDDQDPGERPADAAAPPMSTPLPLPLEAQAMRAASASARRDRDTRQDRDLGEPGAATPLVPSGLSEPSARPRQSGGDPAAVPSWMPNQRVPAQRAGQPAAGAGNSAPPSERAPEDRNVPGLGPAVRGEPAERLPVLGYGGVPGGAASTNGYYGPASAQALADAPSFEAPPLAAPASEPPPYEAHAADPAVRPAAAPPESGESRFSRRRRSAKRRMTTQRIFSELAGQAGIPEQAYAIGDDVDGAMCLVQTEDGFEVFNSLGGARHEVRQFADEESAYFYLFGVLAAEAVRTGTLGVVRSGS